MTRPTDEEVYARHPGMQMVDAVAKAHAKQMAESEAAPVKRAEAPSIAEAANAAYTHLPNHPDHDE